MLTKDEARRDALLVWGVPPWMSVRGGLRRSRPRVQIAKAAITGEYVTQMVARLECGVLAVPVDVAWRDFYYCTPGGIARGVAGRSSEPSRRHKGGDTNCQFRKGFRHDDPSFVFWYLQ
jgi:hypothetical protein